MWGTLWEPLGLVGDSAEQLAAGLGLIRLQEQGLALPSVECYCTALRRAECSWG